LAHPVLSVRPTDALRLSHVSAVVADDGGDSWISQNYWLINTYPADLLTLYGLQTHDHVPKPNRHTSEVRLFAKNWVTVRNDTAYYYLSKRDHHW